MAQLGRALFGHTVLWHADKRLLDDLRGAGVLVEIVLLVDVSTDLLSDTCCPRCSRTDCRVIASVALTEN